MVNGQGQERVNLVLRACLTIYIYRGHRVSKQRQAQLSISYPS